MNTNQITNIVTTIIQALLGALVTKGIISGAEMESIGGAVAALVVFVVSHNWHSSTPPASSGGSSLGGKLPVLFTLGLSALLLSGCAGTPNKVAFQSAQGLKLSVDGAMVVYDSLAAAHKTTPAQNLAVKKAWTKYHDALLLAADAGKAASTSTNSLTAFTSSVDNLNQSKADLLTLLASFGVTL